MRIWKRGGVYYAEWWENGTRRKRSTRTADREVARARGQQWERDSVDPDSARTREATLETIFDALLAERHARAGAGKGSKRTEDFYRQKAGQWLRVLGRDFRASALTAEVVDGYIETRRSEWATDAMTRKVSEHTIAKELVALRAALKVAKRQRTWRGDPGAILPVGFASGYEPRKQFLTKDELWKLLGKLTADRAARVAFIVATGAEWGATDRALREDVSADRTLVLVRGTKRKTRWRTVPVVTDAQHSLLEHAMTHAQGTDGLLFTPWGKAGRDIAAACKRAGVPRVTPNDLRRTCGTWFAEGGASDELIGKLLGHASGEMARKVYGVLTPKALGERLARALGTWDNSGTQPAHPVAPDAPAALPAESKGAGIPAPRGGLSGARSRDQRIKSPPPEWPEPAKPLRKPTPQKRRGTTVGQRAVGALPRKLGRR